METKLFKHSRRELIAIGATVVALLVAYAPTLVELFREWWDVPEYSHGLLMPPVAAWLIWEKRAELSKIRRQREAGSGLLLLGSALVIAICSALLLIGEMKFSWNLKPYAFVTTLVALVTVFYGWRGLRALVAPIVVLYLMCPIPWRMILDVTLPLKRHATVIATGLIEVCGLPVTLQGNLINVSGIDSLWVADACSGVRSLVSLMSVALLGCLFWRRHWSIKAVVLASCIPIAVMVNGMRIWLTAMLSVYISPKAAEGFFHTAEGFVLFGVAALLLWGWAYVLHVLLPRKEAVEKAAADRDAAATPGWSTGRYVATMASIALLVVASFYVYRFRSRLGGEAVNPEVVAKLQKSFDRLPVALPNLELTSERHEWDAKTIKSSGADVYASRVYSNKTQSFRVYLGGSMRSNDNFHSPNVCMPSQGWESLEDRTQALAGNGDRGVRRLLLQRGQEQMLVYFWFQAGDRVATDEFDVRWSRLIDLVRDKPLAPTVIASVYVPVRGSIEATEAAAEKFLAEITPHIRLVANATETTDV